MTDAELASSGDPWSDRVRYTLGRYTEALVRNTAARLLKPRSQWPLDELIERTLETLTNPPVIDRRLKELPISARKLLAVIAKSGQPVWHVSQLLALLAVLDHSEGTIPIQTLLEAGLLFPEIPLSWVKLRNFDDWTNLTSLQGMTYAHPAVLARASAENLELPIPPTRAVLARQLPHADGLEWPLRMALAWQQLVGNPIRLTIQQALFKRDLLRLQGDPLLNAAFAEYNAELPDAGVLAIGLATAVGLLETGENELKAGRFPAVWDAGLRQTLTSLWSAMFRIRDWDPLLGYDPPETESLFASVALPAFLLLAQLPDDGWTTAAAIAEIIWVRHPFFAARLNKQFAQAERWVRTLFLGLGGPLRLVEVVQDDSEWCFRLGDIGQHLLQRTPAPDLSHGFTQTMIVQPNGEMIVYRQGLTPALIGKLSRFATWKTLGAACTLELTAESVYRGLETGQSLADILQVLQQHGTRSLSPTVLDSLQRWANKRERITLHSAATLMEFTTAADLETAFLRGLIAVKITDRIGLVAEGREIDYRHFRLIGNRDYESRPQQCVQFEPDGVTFNVDTAQSDLLLEAELVHLAEPIHEPNGNTRRFRMTVASLRNAREHGFSETELDYWCIERSGKSPSSAIHLLLSGSGGIPAQFSTHLIVRFPSDVVTNGVMQWPTTKKFIAERLGPCAVVVAQENLAGLREELAVIGIRMEERTAEEPGK